MLCRARRSDIELFVMHVCILARLIPSAIGSIKHRGCFNRAIEPRGADVYAWAYPLELNKLRRLYKALGSTNIHIMINRAIYA